MNDEAATATKRLPPATKASRSANLSRLPCTFGYIDLDLQGDRLWVQTTGNASLTAPDIRGLIGELQARLGELPEEAAA